MLIKPHKLESVKFKTQKLQDIKAKVGAYSIYLFLSKKMLFLLAT